MMPMNWFLLYMYFLIIFLLMNTMIYYMYTHYNKNYIKNFNFIMNLKWKW
uniref:ATP synthase F0 subunit 8 n=1 Tax=Discolomatidae sp. 3 ACP-2013 TaxID=1434486 RepID=A0A3G3FWX6_9CUCU|nr:ATP synthase F0 subunit 8 [Discolomatidae sp. 3 ACP-2013]